MTIPGMVEMPLMTDRPVSTQPYHAQITAGGLMAAEGRQVARLLIQGRHLDEADWRKAIVTENALQKRSPTSAGRQAGLLRQRLLAFDEAGWQLIAEGSRDTSRQLLLATALIHSRLLADFFAEVVKPKHQRFDPLLRPADWADYFAVCCQRQPDLGDLAPSTQKKLREVAYRVLVEAGYIPSTRDPRIAPVALTVQTIGYLDATAHRWILNLMDLAHEH